MYLLYEYDELIQQTTIIPVPVIAIALDIEDIFLFIEKEYEISRRFFTGLKPPTFYHFDVKPEHYLGVIEFDGTFIL